MARFLLYPGIALAILSTGANAQAQGNIDVATQRAELNALVEKLKQRDGEARLQVREWARRTGLPARRELPNGKVLELQRFVPGVGPVFYITNNIDAADTVSTDEVWPGGSAGLALTGAGMTVGEWDAGAVLSDHPDLYDRVTQVDGTVQISNHSTHVAGTLIGNGSGLPEARGMAWAAALNAYDWNTDTAEMATAAASGLLLSNHSYGTAAGWIYMGGAPPDQWWWIGGTGQEDPNFGYYDTESSIWDQLAFDAPYYLIVKAAGNDRWDTGPEPGESYTIIDQYGNIQGTSTAPRPADCAPAGYDCLPTHSVAKNILTIGAVDDLIGGYQLLAGPESVQMAGFSSWGPTDDGRIKPDLVGNGIFLMSTYGEDPYYAAALGTSMAAPSITGSLLLLQEHYQDLHGPGSFMRAATLKALAIHTADEAGAADGPDYAFGWGLLNTKSAARVVSEDGAGSHRIIEGSLANGATDTVQIDVSEADVVVRATLVWMDPPATPVPPALDPPDSMLVNDLDLRIEDGTATHLPWVLNPATPAAPAGRGDNFRDNVEQVVVDDTVPGSYFVHVSHKGSLRNGQSQPYSLIISTSPRPATTSGLLIDEDFSGGLPAGWSVNTLYGVSWTINAPVPGDSILDNYTGGQGTFAIVDNDYANYTVTSLQTPNFDLSTAQGAVLRFKSYYVYDFIETINVDVSTNGGAAWNNVWSHQGITLGPMQVVLDLSSAAAGQSSVALRFRFDSGYLGPSGVVWQVDDVQLEAIGAGPPSTSEPPGQAAAPSPANGSSGQDLNTTLSWTAGTNAASHDVYFGTDTPLGAGDFRGNQAGTSFNPGTLQPGTTYHWRVDEVNGDGTTQGLTWSFSTAAAPTGSVSVAGLNGSVIPGSRSRWTAVVDIEVHNQDGAPEIGVTVDGSWSNGSNGSDTCMTNDAGRCTVDKPNLKTNVASVTFTVSDLAKSGMVYDSSGNTADDSVVVNQTAGNLTPNATDDSFQTEMNTPVSGNVMTNDNQGDAPATAELQSAPTSGILNLASDGSFTYTPGTDFEGGDSFSYRLVDVDGDMSNTATAGVTVSPSTPPPPPGGLSLSATPYKIKGIQHVDLIWHNASGNVDLSRNGRSLVSNLSGSTYDDDLGIKGGGQTYSYTVCESDSTTVCATASAAF